MSVLDRICPSLRSVWGLTSLLLLTILLLDPQVAWGQTGRGTGLPVPRFVSLGAERVNVRFGPGRQYPINWVFSRQGLPLEIIDEFDTWRKIRDHEGEEGWVHSSLLSSRRTVMVFEIVREVRRTPEPESRIVLRAEPGVIGLLFDCEVDWCRIEIDGRRGWLRRDEFWGARPDEILN